MSHQPVLKSRQVCQIGLIVRDIEKSAQAFARLFGVDAPHWFLTDAEDKAHTRYQGQPTPAQAKLAFFQLENLSLELIEPVGGPSTWQEFLDTHGPGVHHIAFQIKGMDNQVAALEAEGMPLAQKGDYTGGRYAYIDATAQLNLILELLEND